MSRHTYELEYQVDHELACPSYKIWIDFEYTKPIPAVYSYSGGGMPQAPEGARIEILSVTWQGYAYNRNKGWYRSTGAATTMPELAQKTLGLDFENPFVLDKLIEYAEKEEQ